MRRAFRVVVLVLLVWWPVVALAAVINGHYVRVVWFGLLFALTLLGWRSLGRE